VQSNYGPLCQDYENIIIKLPPLIKASNFLKPANVNWNMFSVLTTYKTHHPKNMTLNIKLFNDLISRFKSTSQCILLPYIIGTQVNITMLKGNPYYGEYVITKVTEDNKVKLKEPNSMKTAVVSVDRIRKPDYEFKNQELASEQASNCDKDRYIEIKNIELDERKNKIARLSIENDIKASQIEELQQVVSVSF
jgi:hypothetical protein